MCRRRLVNLNTTAPQEELPINASSVTKIGVHYTQFSRRGGGYSNLSLKDQRRKEVNLPTHNLSEE
jgi:hypothetical protein